MDDLSVGTIGEKLHSSPIRGYTHHRILRAIAQGLGGGVRAKIASRLNVSPATVTKAVALMTELELVEPDEARPSPTGRPTVPLRLARKFVLIGIAVISLQGTPHRLQGTVIYLNGDPVEERDSPRARQLPPEAHTDPEAFIDAVVSFALELTSIHPRADVLGCGVNLGGYISSNTGEIKRGSGPIGHLTGARSSALKNRVQEALQLPVVLGNDITSLAMRSNLRPGQPAESYALLVPTDFGVGGALVMKGRTWLGAHDMASEPGHIPCPGTVSVTRLPDDDAEAPDIALKVPWCQCETAGPQHRSCRPDRCTQRPAGHVEAYASPHAIERRAVENGLVANEQPIAELAARPREERELGLVFYQAGVALAAAAVPIVDWFDPEQVLVYLPDELHQPGPDQVGSYYLEGLWNELERKAFTDEADRGHGAKVLQVEPLPTPELYDQLASAAAYLVFRRLLRVLTEELSDDGDTARATSGQRRSRPSTDELHH